MRQSHSAAGTSYCDLSWNAGAWARHRRCRMYVPGLLSTYQRTASGYHLGICPSLVVFAHSRCRSAPVALVPGSTSAHRTTLWLASAIPRATVRTEWASDLSERALVFWLGFGPTLSPVCQNAYLYYQWVGAGLNPAAPTNLCRETPTTMTARIYKPARTCDAVRSGQDPGVGARL